MRLRNMILVAAAVFSAIAITSCSKADEEDINVYGMWQVVDTAGLPDGFIMGFINVDHDSIAPYGLPSASKAAEAGISADSIYLIDSKAAIGSVVTNSDSAVISATLDGKENRMVFRKLIGAGYLFVSQSEGRTDSLAMLRVSGITRISKRTFKEMSSLIGD